LCCLVRALSAGVGARASLACSLPPSVTCVLLGLLVIISLPPFILRLLGASLSVCVCAACACAASVCAWAGACPGIHLSRLPPPGWQGGSGRNTPENSGIRVSERRGVPCSPRADRQGGGTSPALNLEMVCGVIRMFYRSYAKVLLPPAFSSSIGVANTFRTFGAPLALPLYFFAD
jgi:hypothetical protein